jgi:hypothetical protein
MPIHDPQLMQLLDTSHLSPCTSLATWEDIFGQEKNLSFRTLECISCFVFFVLECISCFVLECGQSHPHQKNEEQVW